MGTKKGGEGTERLGGILVDQPIPNKPNSFGNTPENKEFSKKAVARGRFGEMVFQHMQAGGKEEGVGLGGGKGGGRDGEWEKDGFMGEKDGFMGEKRGGKNGFMGGREKEMGGRKGRSFDGEDGGWGDGT